MRTIVTPYYGNNETPLPFRRAPLAKRSQVRRPYGWRGRPKVTTAIARRRGTSHGYGYGRLSVLPAYDITGSHNQEAGPVGKGAPLFVMPYDEPGLGALWSGHLNDPHLEGLSSITKVFKKAGKVGKKVVRSKAFKYAAIATAVYFTAGAAAPYFAGAGAAGTAGTVGAKAAAWKLLAKKAAAALAKKVIASKLGGGTPAPALLTDGSSQQPILPAGYYYDAEGNVHDQAGNVWKADGTPISSASQQIILPAGYYWDAAGNVHDQAGNVYQKDGTLISRAPGTAIGGEYEAATPADPGGAIPGEFTPIGTPAAPAMAGLDVSGLLKIGIPLAIGLVLISAAGGGGTPRRRRRR